MFQVYDSKEHKYIGNQMTLRINADRFCQRLNIKTCGVDDFYDKSPQERRFVVKEMNNR